MFWVTMSMRCSESPSPLKPAQRASASCPAFGEVEFTIPMRHRYQAHTSSGSARQPSSVAIASGE